MKNVLVVRFSAFGDVLLCYPVLKAIIHLNPDVQFTFVTRKTFQAFFQDIPELKVVGVDLKKQYKGIKGIYQLSKDLKKAAAIDCICDLHQVLRTHILNFFLAKKTFKINKGRKEKKKFVQKKSIKKLPHSAQRYLKVFSDAGLIVPDNLETLENFQFEKKNRPLEIEHLLSRYTGKKLVGLAPFSLHFTKSWPLSLLERFLELANKNEKMQFFIFGGPGKEAQEIARLESKYPNAVAMAGKYSFMEELSAIQSMDAMITMDSANMYLAYLSNVPLIAIWGGTHPDIGFSPLSSKAINLQIPKEELPCRPCSVFGRADCPEEHFRCMKEITAEMLLEKLESI